MLVTAIDNLRSQRSVLQRVGSRLETGGLVAVPTESGYRWLVRADHASAPATLLQQMELPPDRPMGFLCGNLQQARALFEEDDEGIRKLIELYWPGPLALVARRRAGWKAPALIERLLKVVVRFPQHPLAQELATLCPFRLFSLGIRDKAGVPLTRASQVREQQRWATQLGSQVETLSWTDPCLRLESTVVDVSTHPPRVLRAGFVTHRELRTCLGRHLVLSGDMVGAKQFARELSTMHSILVEGESSPRVVRRLRTLLDTFGGQRVALVLRKPSAEETFGPIPPDLAFFATYDPEQDLAALEQSLFETLRHVEQKVRADLLLIEGPRRDGPAAPLIDRLRYHARETINTDLPGYSGNTSVPRQDD